jgi:hypothetical protein
VAGVGGEGDPRAGRADEPFVADDKGGAARFDDAGTEGDGVVGAGEVLGDDGELVATETGEGVPGAQRLQEPFGHLREHRVTDVMAQGVVDELEPIEVQEQHRDQTVVTVETVQGVAEAVHEDGAVGDARERIGVCLALQVELGLAAIGDVAHCRHDESLPAAVVDSRP